MQTPLRKTCIICETEIHRSTNKMGVKMRRSDRAVTCCKKCSKTYNRIAAYLRHRLRAGTLDSLELDE